jgi:hypothetical protein
MLACVCLEEFCLRFSTMVITGIVNSKLTRLRSGPLAQVTVSWSQPFATLSSRMLSIVQATSRRTFNSSSIIRPRLAQSTRLVSRSAPKIRPLLLVRPRPSINAVPETFTISTTGTGLRNAIPLTSLLSHAMMRLRNPEPLLRLLLVLPQF